MSNVGRLTMIRYLGFLIILLSVVSLFGCKEESQEERFVMEGIVAEVSDAHVFIYEEQSGISRVLTKEEAISKSIQSSSFGFDDKISDIEVGDKVKVWYDAIDHSLPASGHGTKIELIKRP